MLKYLICVLYIFLTFAAFGQSYPLGLNPPGLDWKQINTEKVQIIFPESSRWQAQRVANMVHLLYDSAFYSLGDRKSKVSIILQNQTTISNGFVTVGPFRSEFYVNAPQVNFSGVTDWIDLLTIHEYRHVEQFTNAKKGLTKISSILFGENGWGLFAGLALPRWFFEGDAIYYETLLTNGGRGRMPAFVNEYRALLLSGKKFNYEKASATSLKEFVPDHYTLGYFMTTSLRRKFGANAWEPVVSDAVSYKGLFYPFNRSMRKNYKLGSPALYRKTMNELKADWEAEAEKIDLTSYEVHTPEKRRTFTNYRNPTFINESKIIFERSGFNEIPTYYTLNLETNEIIKVIKPGIYLDGNATLDYKHGISAWSELAYDSRWGNKNYSIIALYDHNKKEKKLLTHKTRYFAPDFSEDLRIAVIHSPEDQEFELRILESRLGNTLQTISFEKGIKIAFPQWVSDNKIAVILSKNSRNAIGIINLDNKETNLITPYWDDQISYLKYANEHLFFSGTFTGIDNIFCLKLSDNSIYQVTSSEFGATQPDISPSFKTMVYSNYTAEGYDIVTSELDPETWKLLRPQSHTQPDYFKPVADPGNILEKVPDTEFPISSFSTKNGFVNIHSWYPNILPPNFGLVISADNKLSTFSADASATYNRNEETITYGIEFEYGEYFPVYGVEYDFTRRNRYVPVSFLDIQEQDTSLRVTSRTQSWTEHQAVGGITLPINLTGGNLFSRFWISSRYHQLWVDYENDITGKDETFGALDFEINSYVLRRAARQHLNPRLGLTFTLQYLGTVGTTFNKSNFFLVNSTAFLPGLSKNHSTYINLSYKSEPYEAQYKFRDNFFYARGHSAFPHDKIWKIGFNYALPLLYPDLPIGPFFFFKRIKSTFFYDLSQSTQLARTDEDFVPLPPLLSASFRVDPMSIQYQSVGVELTSDFRFMRGLDIDMGVRYSYLLGNIYNYYSTSYNRHQFDLIVFSISY